MFLTNTKILTIASICAAFAAASTVTEMEGVNSEKTGSIHRRTSTEPRKLQSITPSTYSTA